MGRSIKAASISGVRHAIQTSIDADLVSLVSALTLFFRKLPADDGSSPLCFRVFSDQLYHGGRTRYGGFARIGHSPPPQVPACSRRLPHVPTDGR